MIKKFYRQLYRIRRVEEEISRLYPSDKIKSPIHLSIGQETVSVGVCTALQHEDIVFGSYRSHALYLAKGGNLKRMIAELYGKAAGCSKGKGGSMHLVDPEAGIMGTSAIVSAHIPHAVGYAYALKLQKRNSIAVCFFGDGAVEEGAFHESLNFAALKNVPILFICENNGLAVHSRIENRQSNPRIFEKARAYGIPATAFTSDIFQIYEAASRAAAEIRDHQAGPRFLEFQTCRVKEHVGPGEDFHAGYRNFEEARPFIEKDSISSLAEQLDPIERFQMASEIEKEIKEAFQFAEKSPWPDESELWNDFSEENSCLES